MFCAARLLPASSASARICSAPGTRYTDLGYGYYQARTDLDCKLRNHIRQIQALCFADTLIKAP